MKTLPILSLALVLCSCGADVGDASETETVGFELPALDPSAAEAPTEPLVEPAGVAGGQAPSPVLLMVHAGEPMVVIDADPELADGVTGLADVTLPMSAERVGRRPIADTELGEAALALLGQRVRVHGPRGEVCVATLSDPWLVERTAVERYGDQAEDWSEGPPRAVVAASLYVERGSCFGATFAQLDERAGLHFSLRDDLTLSLDLEARALEAMTALPAYHAIQARYEEGDFWRSEEAPLPSAWRDYSASTTFALFRHAASGRTLLRVATRAGDGCGDFHGALTVLWELTASGLVTRNVEESEESASDIVEHGAALSFVSDGAVRSKRGDEWLTVDVTSTVWHCPC